MTRSDRTGPTIPLENPTPLLRRNGQRIALRPGAALTLLGLIPATPASAGWLDPPSAAETAAFDEAWQGFTLYRNSSNPLLEEFKLRGRYHGQYYDVDAGRGSASDWEDRRSRLGFDAKLFDSHLEIRADVASNDGFRDGYDGLVDAYLRWLPGDGLAITLGRTKPFIGYYDWLPSSNNQPTFERSQIFNQLNVDRATGLTAEGSLADFRWQAGVFSNSIDPDRNSTSDAFGEFNASWTLTLGAGYDLSGCSGLEKTDLQINFLHSDRDADSNLFTRYGNILSGTLWVQDGRWSGVAEAYHASGGLGGDGDVLGGFVLGTYDLVPKRLQLVGRYSFSVGDGPASVRGQNRHEGAVGALRGDTYQAVYLGTQYFINGDRLKLMAGVEYASLSGGPTVLEYDGFTWMSGIRFSF